MVVTYPLLSNLVQNKTKQKPNSGAMGAIAAGIQSGDLAGQR